MDRAAIEPAIRILLTEIHARLSEAAGIAKAAEACALAGSIAQGVTVSMDIEQLEQFPLFVNRGDSQRPANKIR